MFNVYFQNNCKDRRLIGAKETHEEAIMVIRDFLKSKNYDSPYWRSWVDDKNLEWFDVGSWSEFFIIEKTTN